jgi:hypothetical protein
MGAEGPMLQRFLPIPRSCRTKNLKKELKKFKKKELKKELTGQLKNTKLPARIELATFRLRSERTTTMLRKHRYLLIYKC